jgi:hypothetical protein
MCRTYLANNDNEKEEDSFFDAFTVVNLPEGSIPPCVYSLPFLEVFYASGNGLHGTLPQDITPTLTAIDLSLNRLEGRIPEALITPQLTLLDLESNQLNGTLSVFNNKNLHPSLDLNLAVNHISGEIPENVLALTKVNILTGNVYGCGSPKPKHDPHKIQYSCGSQDLDNSLYMFIVLSSSVHRINMYFITY